jgi:hypothetical protein
MCVTIHWISIFLFHEVQVWFTDVNRTLTHMTSCRFRTHSRNLAHSQFQ